MTPNDLHVSDGRGTEAQNCKPITNLKEKSELSNFCKTSAYRLHAVRRWQVCPAYVLQCHVVMMALENCWLFCIFCVCPCVEKMQKCLQYGLADVCRC
jgi:hypothetical protein